MTAALSAAAMGVSACGPGESGNSGHDAGAGAAGQGGNAGTGGIEGGAGGNPCANQPYDGLASRKFEVGETGSVEVNLGDQHPKQAYNGLKLTIANGQVFTKSTLVGVRDFKYDNFPTGVTSVGDLDMVRVEALDGDEPFVPDQIGGCQPNPVAVNEVADSALMDGPPAVFATIYRVRNEVQENVPFVFTNTNTQFPITSLNTADYPFGNRKPVVPDTISAVRGLDGFITVDLTGTTDESVGNALLLGKLGFSVQGLNFIPKPGEPGRFITTAAVPQGQYTSLNGIVSGANQPLGVVDDTTPKNITVTETDPCIGVDCNGHGTCTTGACVCDAGFAEVNCDGCDLASGLYEDDYPLCSPDITPPSAPVITTNGGVGYVIYQPSFVIEGTTDADTYDMWQNIDGGAYSQFPYTHYSINWLFNGNIPNQFEIHDYCFKASDKAGNMSNGDCITVYRE